MFNVPTFSGHSTTIAALQLAFNELLAALSTVQGAKRTCAFQQIFLHLCRRAKQTFLSLNG